MGIRAPSFALLTEGPLPANAGLLAQVWSCDSVTITSAAGEIPTTTAWSGSEDGPSGGWSFQMLRPTAGDWPLGPLNVVARGWQQVIRECEVIVGPAVDGAPPTCDFISDRIELRATSYPGGGGRTASAGIAFAGLTDAHGPLVLFDVELELEVAPGKHHTYRRQNTANAKAGGGVIDLGPEPFAIKRVSISNVIGKTLEIVPPFPHGQPPSSWGKQPLG